MKDKNQLLPKNEVITANWIFLIDENKKAIGRVSWDQAMILAEEKGLDLVGVNLKADPPICKLVDVGKLKYQEEKLKQKQNKGGKTEIKEIKLSFNIDEHDLEVRKKKAVKFLDEGHHLRITLQIKGREMRFSEKGFEVIKNFVKDIGGKFIQEPKKMGWRFTAVAIRDKDEKNQS